MAIDVITTTAPLNQDTNILCWSDDDGFNEAAVGFRSVMPFSSLDGFGLVITNQILSAKLNKSRLDFVTCSVKEVITSVIGQVKSANSTMKGAHNNEEQPILDVAKAMRKVSKGT